MPLVSMWREKRGEFGLTLEEASNRMGITKDALSKIERGMNFVGKDTLNAACRVYSCQPNDLYRFMKEEELAVA